MIIVIDGPAGSGKSSTARAVADRLNIQYLDSGALYRTLTVVYLESGKDEKKFFELLKEKSIEFHYEDDTFHVMIDSEDVTAQIRNMKVSSHVSTVAAMPASRTVVNNLMRRAIRQDVWIAEGRDLGTAVFPDADLKFFMIADMETRVDRRYKELKSKGAAISREEVRRNVVERDQKDSQREADPLKKADDAIEVDTTDMNFEQQVNFICSTITDKLERQA